MSAPLQELRKLQQVGVPLVGDGFTAELVFDEPCVKETVVDFAPRPGS